MKIDTIIDGFIDVKLGVNGILLTSVFDDYDTLDEVLQIYSTGCADISINSHFCLKDILNSAISGYEMSNCNIDIEAKPLFDAMRYELSEMLDRIDQLKFSTHDEIRK